MVNVWDQIEADCLRIFSLPHNIIRLKQERTTPIEAARQQVSQVKSGLGGSATRREFSGPRLFFRVVGPTNSAYSGMWWFDPDQFHRLEAAYARIYFQTPDRKAAVRDMLRELLAIASDFNNLMTEIYALALPHGQRLVGYVGVGAPQPFSQLPGARMLVGQAEQTFFPPDYNPLWVTKYSSLVL